MANNDQALMTALSCLSQIEQWQRLYEWASDAYPEAKTLDIDDRQYMVRDLGWKDDPDPQRIGREVEERVSEYPLEVSVRSDWHAIGESGEPTEYLILLCTGGPAVRITGNLNRYSEPSSAVIECQDWGTPWEEVSVGMAGRDALMWFASMFWFGQ